jgi:SAM-dependent MidA family methyltransferase
MTDQLSTGPEEQSPLPPGLRIALQVKDLPFDQFMSLALYAEGSGYYSGPLSPAGREGDFVTSPHISPLFGFALARLATEFMRRQGDGPSAIVDIGCGDGKLLSDLIESLDAKTVAGTRFYGVDRRLGRTAPAAAITFLDSIEGLPWELPLLLISNELYDAFPFSRVVQRADGLHELMVGLEGEGLVWRERPAGTSLVDYFRERSIILEEGQFADLTPEWGGFHTRLLKNLRRGLVVTFDYGSPEGKLFSPAFRRFGTAGAFSRQQVSRDLLASPGKQDLTAHINWTDLERAGAQEGADHLFRGRQAGFLISIGALDYPLLAPDRELTAELANARRDALQLVLPDGIGEEMTVLVQSKGLPVDGWSFQRGMRR